MTDSNQLRALLNQLSPSGTKAQRAEAIRGAATAIGMSTPELDWQPFITLKGTGGAATRIHQGSDDWIYVGDVPAVSVRVEVPFITAGATLRVETAVSLDGPWRDVVLQTGTSANREVRATEMDQARECRQARNAVCVGRSVVLVG